MPQKFLFPQPDLDPGSDGRAVNALGIFLYGAGCAEEGLTLDGDYGPKMVESVKKLQTLLGLNPDGRFGPATREAVFQKYGVDFNALPAGLFSARTIAA